MNDAPRLLIADDDPSVLALLRTLAEDGGYDVLAATDGGEAVRLAVDELPDLVLLDALMPVMSGFEATRRLRGDERTKHLPVIILTALQGREDRLAGIAAGADDFLTKPVDGEELLIRVRNNLDRKAYHDLLARHNAILEQKVAERTRELREALERVTAANLDTVARLALVAEYRDEGTGAHIRRISRSVAVLAREPGLERESIATIEPAAAMHDIGKIQVPDRILLKNGPLDAEEWRVMQEHTLAGERLLEGSSSPYLVMARDIAGAHHERWDGSGYPRGLAGGRIPLPARITAIVDQYDAL